MTAFAAQSTSAFTMSPASSSRAAVDGLRVQTGVFRKKSFELNGLLSPEQEACIDEKQEELAEALAILKMASSTYEEDLVNPDFWNFAPLVDWDEFYGKL